MEKTAITGIVLAGGKSSRMGTDKAMLAWKDKTLIEHAIEKLKSICGKVIISSNKPVYGFTGCEIWPDELPQQAPIIGIYSCLKRSETNINMVLSCDMPLAGTELLRHLLVSCREHPLLVPVHDDGLVEPLCGVYKKAIIPGLEKYIRNNNLSLYQFIQENASHLLEIDGRLPFYHNNLFANINTPEDLEKLVNRIG